MQESGYDKDRFPNMSGDQFDCIICSQIAKNPQECSGCGNLFCHVCITSWKQKSQECPNRCAKTNQISPCSKALLRMYNNLDVNCMYYEKCKKIVKLCDLEQHERTCQIPQCKNSEICKNNAQKKSDFCDNPPCKLIIQMKACGNNNKQMLGEISTFLGQYHKQPQYVQSIIKNPANLGGNHFTRWSNKNKGTGIELSDSNLKVWLKESAYAFRTVITDIPFQNGLHYWEIIADDRTENELKIGIVTKQEFQYNSCFCDFEYGFAFYGLGQLRHNSNASGSQYGKRFKKEGVLGCFLNMNKGQLSFALNGEFMGIAFQNDALKKGPIYASVALLHCAGCTIDSSKQVPAYFPQ